LHDFNFSHDPNLPPNRNNYQIRTGMYVTGSGPRAPAARVGTQCSFDTQQGNFDTSASDAGLRRLCCCGDVGTCETQITAA
jgi:hypothetical protein